MAFDFRTSESLPVNMTYISSININGSCILAYIDAADSSKAKLVKVINDDSLITFGTPVVINNAATSALSMANLDDGVFVVSWCDGTHSYTRIYQGSDLSVLDSARQLGIYKGLYPASIEYIGKATISTKVYLLFAVGLIDYRYSGGTKYYRPYVYQNIYNVTDDTNTVNGWAGTTTTTDIYSSPVIILDRVYHNLTDDEIKPDKLMRFTLYYRNGYDIVYQNIGKTSFTGNMSLLGTGNANDSVSGNSLFTSYSILQSHAKRVWYIATGVDYRYIQYQMFLFYQNTDKKWILTNFFSNYSTYKVYPSWDYTNKITLSTAANSSGQDYAAVWIDDTSTTAGGVYYYYDPDNSNKLTYRNFIFANQGNISLGTEYALTALSSSGNTPTSKNPSFDGVGYLSYYNLIVWDGDLYDFKYPINAYADDTDYSYISSTDGKVDIALSINNGSSYTSTKTFTFPTGSANEAYVTVGSDSDTWGLSIDGEDLDDGNLTIKLYLNSDTSETQEFSDFGFTVSGTYRITGVEARAKGYYNDTTDIIYINSVSLKVYYGNTPTPVTEGSMAYASDGRKNGEAVGAGSGVTTFWDGSDWIAVDSGVNVDD